jgi:hypothetical protein
MVCVALVALCRSLRYVAFDFHQECGGMRYDRLSLLWDEVCLQKRVLGGLCFELAFP